MKKTVLITGADGFIGRNLTVRLADRDDLVLLRCTRETTGAELATMAAAADVVFHLAGINRPQAVEEFEIGNVGLTRDLIDYLRQARRTPVIVFSSSIQIRQANPYGQTKLAAEEALREFADETGAPVVILRLRNVFGKWCRPEYNSVVATFCHNIARGQPITITDPAREIELVYIDDVVDSLLDAGFGGAAPGDDRVAADTMPTTRIGLGDLADRLRTFASMQQTLLIPDFSLRFDQQLYATYLSYVDPQGWVYSLQRRSDDRGDLAEWVKSHAFGQIFVSRTHPGITRGNHYHHTKTEKFFVISGVGLVQFRHVERDEVFEFVVRGEEYRVIDIPPGYTHSITNVGDGEMITLFWASEIFDPDRPDTAYLPVMLPGQSA